MRHSRTKAWVVLKERRHPLRVTRQNNYQVLALLFHHLKQHLDCFLAVVALILRTI